MLKKAEERKLVQVLMFFLNSVINLTLRVTLVFKDSSEDPVNRVLALSSADKQTNET